MDRPEIKLISLKVSDVAYTVDIELINRPIQGKAQNYILVSRSSSSPDCTNVSKEHNDLSNMEERIKWEKSISTELVEKILNKLEHTGIPPYKNGIFGLDGISYTISFGDFGCYSAYHWWCNAPKGWEPLEEIAETLYSHSGKAGYGV